MLNIVYYYKVLYIAIHIHENFRGRIVLPLSENVMGEHIFALAT